MASLSGIFDKVSYNSPKTSVFNANHDIKTTFKVGEVAPLECIPVYAKDNFNLKYDMQARFSPLIAPAYQRMSIKNWSLYVRNSDLWDDFNFFFTGVNPRIGKTAYDQNVDTPVHPYFKLDSIAQFGTSHLGVKLNLNGIDISDNNIRKEGETYYINHNLIYEVFSQIRENLSLNNAYSIEYNNGVKCSHLYSAFGNEFNYSAESIEDINDQNSYATLVQFFHSDAGVQEEVSNNLFVVQRGLRPLVENGSLFDYLGYPSFNFRHFFNSDDFVTKIKDYGKLATTPEIAKRFINRYFFSDSLDSANSMLGQIVSYLPRFYFDDSLNRYYVSTDILTNIKRLKFGSIGGYVPFIGYLPNQHSISFYRDVSNFDFEDGSLSFSYPSIYDIICRYLIWMKITNHNTTMVSDAPYFDILPLHMCVTSPDEELDSLRVRGYHKIWNDYFREPTLTAEIPVPYSDGGNDLQNYYNAIERYLDSNFDVQQGLFDWKMQNLFSNFDFSPQKSIDHLYSDELIPLFNLSLYQNVDGKRAFVSQVLWDLLTRPYKHLRKRDYITGAMPNTSVVDVVAPIMPTNAVDSYEKQPYTNNSLNGEGDNLIHDNTTIDPQPAENDTPNMIGWLDIENLRITQALKNYFKSLRHAMNGIKDYIKVFFDVDIDDLTLHRAKLLNAYQHYVSISEVTSMADTEFAPTAALAGKAQLYGESPYLSEFIKEPGFIITLACLSPEEINVGGLDRQLIRKDRFDYFNPAFAELGDMKITNIEVCANPLFSSKGREFYDQTFGYTQRFMNLKYIADHVHGDFLGDKSDWHLDIIQPAIQDGTIRLSQQFLEEKESDRIFNDVRDNEDNCFVWVQVNCSYQRALPTIVREVIA